VPLDPRVKRFLDALAAGNPPNALDTTVEKRRLGLAELMKLAGPETPVGRVEDRTLPGPAGPLGVRIYTPLGAKPDLLPGLIYFHGGGLVAGTVATHDPIGRALANSGACRVVSVEYRLAPEHRFPAALDDALAAVRHIGAHAAEFGIDGKRLGICGDSAGGTLAAATAQTVARIGSPRLALQLLICPILDYSRSTDSKRDLASGYLVDQATLDHDLLHYAPPGTADPANPRISPLRAEDVAGLPRTLIHTAEFDPLRDEGRDYFERLARAHTEVSYTCHPGMIHLFYGLGAVIPYARTAFEQIGGEIRAALA
jgi:acetyl esterase/lipase